jgi:hypothetical protein
MSLGFLLSYELLIWLIAAESPKDLLRLVNSWLIPSAVLLPS